MLSLWLDCRLTLLSDSFATTCSLEGSNLGLLEGLS